MVARSLAIVFLFCSISLAQKTAWPTILKGRNMSKVVEVSTNDGSQIYRGKFFQFISDSEIKVNDMRRFAATAESVHYALKKLPLNLVHPPRFDLDRDTHSIYIYADIAAYDKAVGVKHSAGYYSKFHRSVYLRKDLFITATKPNYKLLVHELTHLNMHGIIRYSNAWFSEGNAEYMASSFYNNSSYNFSTMTANIRKRALSFIPPNEKKTKKKENAEEVLFSVWEGYFQTIIYLVTSYMDMTVNSEMTKHKGRLDLIAESDDFIYLMEFKLNESSTIAIEQIKSQDYAAAYQNSPKKIFLVGVNFSKTERNVENWESVIWER